MRMAILQRFAVLTLLMASMHIVGIVQGQGAVQARLYDGMNQMGN